MLVDSDCGRCFLMRDGVSFGQESKCPRFTDRSSVDRFGLKAQECRYFDKSCVCFGLTDYAVCLWVPERDNRSVGCGVFYSCWDYGDVP